MSQLFLPLRSNAAWFTSADTRDALERRMKQYALLYDQVVLQNGRYRFVAVDSGGVETYVPPGVDDESRLSIDYYTPGSEFAVRISADPDGEWHPLIAGQTRASYAADFLPILHDAGMLSGDYFAWFNGDIDQNAKAAAKAHVGSLKSVAVAL